MNAGDHRVETGLQRLAKGKGCVALARGLLGKDRSAAEREARDALGVLRSAMDWLEDTEWFDVAHQELDHAGRFVRETFGCVLHQEGTSAMSCANCRVEAL